MLNRREGPIEVCSVTFDLGKKVRCFGLVEEFPGLGASCAFRCGTNSMEQNRYCLFGPLIVELTRLTAQFQKQMGLCGIMTAVWWLEDLAYDERRQGSMLHLSPY